jgi:Holliday junction resolvase RusA-like endonuclease
MIIIEVIGDPKPQPRARSFILRGRGGKPIVGKNGQPILRVHEAGTAEAWKQAIALAASPQVPMPPMDGPIRLDIEFRFARPKQHFNSRGLLKPKAPHWHTAHRGDRDNLDKAVLDTLTSIGMWRDDSQVCDGRISKRYANPGEAHGAAITLEQLENAPIFRSEPKVQRVLNFV